MNIFLISPQKFVLPVLNRSTMPSFCGEEKYQYLFNCTEKSFANSVHPDEIANKKPIFVYVTSLFKIMDSSKFKDR